VHSDFSLFSFHLSLSFHKVPAAVFVVRRHGGERGQRAGHAGISRRFSAQVRPLTGHAQVSLVGFTCYYRRKMMLVAG